jgi:pimeloyl-ACP methyl ester carboxylesterase
LEFEKWSENCLTKRQDLRHIKDVLNYSFTRLHMESPFYKADNPGAPRSFFLPVLLLLALLITACGKDRDDPISEPEFLVDSELIVRYSVADIKESLGEVTGLPPGLAPFINYDVSVYRIVYRTVDTDDRPVLASGALVVPEETMPMPLMSFQHGTLGSESEAPSYFTSDSYFATAVYASSGYIIAIPDYLGYGNSKQIDHPYEHGHSLATAARDMLRAVREFDESTNIFRANNKLFLTGYSQGGYATMALLKLLEENHSDEFLVTATTAGAGAYNKSGFARHILEWDGNLRYLNSFLWVLETYDRVYGLNRGAGFYFNEPYATIIEAEGVRDNKQLNPQELFSETFREGILSGADNIFIEVLADNDNYDWKPRSPLQLYHGTNDDYVFYFNSENAYDAMTGRGANLVELITVQDGDHYTTVFNYLLGSFLFFSQYHQ